MQSMQRGGSTRSLWRPWIIGVAFFLSFFQLTLGSAYLNCGGPTFINRIARKFITWRADTDLNNHGSTFVGLANGNETIYTTIYQSVRIFDNREGKTNTYAIQVSTKGYYWVRLYFVEILYRDVNLRSFNVSLEGTVVLENFNVAKVMQGERKEFLIPVTDGTLDISFIRGSIGDPMISGIEVVPVASLFYGLNVSENLVLDTLHRISCGANSSLQDSLGRIWKTDNGLYSPMVETFVLETNLFIHYEDKLIWNAKTVNTAPDFHPKEVYQAKRSTVNGYETETNSSFPAFPLTYSLQVTPGQSHLIRLGFAELLMQWNRSRVLNVTIDGKLGLSMLDPYSICGFAEPCVSNLEVMSNPSGILIITISPGAYLGYTRDSFLSSLEVFRIRSPLNSSTDLQTEGLSGETDKTNKTDKPSVWQSVWIGALSGTLLSVVFLVILIIFLYFRHRDIMRATLLAQKIEQESLLEPTDALPGTEGLNDSLLSLKLSRSVRSELYSTRTFSYKEVKIATSGFSEANVVGRGGFGEVYHGFVGNGVEVAVKRRAVQSKQGEREFRAEVELLSRLHHRNLLGLRGFADQAGHLVLVYDYMPNGTLYDYLRDKDKVKDLQWKRRLQIAIGAARGLEYLHHGAMPPVIHRDVKTSNILLDASLNAKVADFGLSKIREVDSKLAGEPASHISTIVKGTPGYLDPAYYASQQLSEKSDVYGFGIVMLELLTGRLPIWMDHNSGEGASEAQAVSLREWAAEHLERKDVATLTAPELHLPRAFTSMQLFAELAWRCVSIKTSLRPSMNEVVRELEEAQKLLEEELMVSSRGRHTSSEIEISDDSMNSEISVVYEKGKTES